MHGAAHAHFDRYLLQLGLLGSLRSRAVLAVVGRSRDNGITVMQLLFFSRRPQQSCNRLLFRRRAAEQLIGERGVPKINGKNSKAVRATY